MHTREIMDGVRYVGAVDWDRRLFDALIPLPDGTGYNAYLIRGKERTVLIDTVDPARQDTLMKQLEDVETLDFIVSHHTEQDHSGAIPEVLRKYPTATVLATPKGKTMLVDHLCLPEERIITVEDGQVMSIGGKSLTFVHTPWVHWPETMCTYVPEDKILFSCDFFGSHLAASDLFVTDQARVNEAAKRYYAEIMMPFRAAIKKNLEKLDAYDIAMIAPSHGPIYKNPEYIRKAYQDWISDTPKNSVVIPYVSMHGSTGKMVEHLTAALAARGIEVHQFELSSTDLGKLAITLVDAATIIIGTPTVHVGPHPLAAYAAMLANALRPKAGFAGIIGSFGWSSKAAEMIAGLIPNLKAELIEPVICRGYPRKKDLEALEGLAETIAEKHASIPAYGKRKCNHVP